MSMPTPSWRAKIRHMLQHGRDGVVHADHLVTPGRARVHRASLGCSSSRGRVAPCARRTAPQHERNEAIVSWVADRPALTHTSLVCNKEVRKE